MRRVIKMLYSELYPKSLTDGEGLIYSLMTLPNTPWSALTTADAANLERSYGIRSGIKTVYSGFISISDNNRASVILRKYEDKWIKYFFTLNRLANS